MAQSLKDIQRKVVEAGVDYRLMRGKRQAGTEVPVIRLAYQRPVAVPPVCDKWGENVGRNEERVPYPNFGCATQRNLAVMVDNARDLQRPQDEDPRSSERRSVTWSSYVGVPQSGGGDGGGVPPMPRRRHPRRKSRRAAALSSLGRSDSVSIDCDRQRIGLGSAPLFLWSVDCEVPMAAQGNTQPPPSAIAMRLAAGFQASQAVIVAAQLGIADLLSKNAMTSREVAQKTGTHPDMMHRLLRALAAFDVVEDCGDGKFQLTPVGHCLRADAPNSVRPLVLMYGNFWPGFASLGECIKTGKNCLRAPAMAWKAASPTTRSIRTRRASSMPP